MGAFALAPAAFVLGGAVGAIVTAIAYVYRAVFALVRPIRLLAEKPTRRALCVGTAWVILGAPLLLALCVIEGLLAGFYLGGLSVVTALLRSGNASEPFLGVESRPKHTPHTASLP